MNYRNYSQDVETRDHVIGFQEEIAKAEKHSREAFFGWFDGHKSIDEAFRKGSSEFYFYIFQHALPLLADPHEKAALEIGFGGGRLLAAASRCMKQVHGVDIHGRTDIVLEELHNRGNSNVELYTTEGEGKLPLENQSVDLVYSFVVLQHVQKLERFETYLRESARVLKPGGVAVLYFGRYRFRDRLFSGKLAPIMLFVEKVLERLALPKGYKEFPAQVNYTNLILTRWFAKKIARRNGFKIKKVVVSYRGLNREPLCYGGQWGLVLQKS